MRRAFTLTELMVVLTILAMVASIIIPMAGDNDASQLRAAAEMLAADIEDIQARSLANPTEASCLQPLPDGSGWQLEEATTPGAPLLGPDGSPLVRRFGEGPLSGSNRVFMESLPLPESGLHFDDQGAPIALPSSITFELGVRKGQARILVEVSASTGRTLIERP